MRSVVCEQRRCVRKSVSLPQYMIKAFEARAKQERRAFSTYVQEALEHLLAEADQREKQEV